ncbi:MAG TPA: Hpt domain-containing protein [Thiotrichaceae bacterium]|nr:Hpt domain-containing protein [Thiotrichaceae bacterium]
MSNNNVLSLTMLASKRHDLKERGGINWLIDLFINELPNYINELQQAINSGDGEAVFLAAHKFKGSSSNLGAVGMVALCRQLEAIGRAGDIQQAKWVMENVVDKEIKCLKEALEQEKLREK